MRCATALVLCWATPVLVMAADLPAPKTPAEEAVLALLPALSECVSLTAQEVLGPASATVFVDTAGRVAALNVSLPRGVDRLSCWAATAAQDTLLKPSRGAPFGAPVLDGARGRVQCDVERNTVRCDGTYVALDGGVEGPARPMLHLPVRSAATHLRAPRVTPAQEADSPSTRRLSRALLYCLNTVGGDVPLPQEGQVSFGFESGAAAPHFSKVQPAELSLRVVPCMRRILQPFPPDQLPRHASYVYSTVRGQYRPRRSGLEVTDILPIKTNAPGNVSPPLWSAFERDLQGAVRNCILSVPLPDRPPGATAAVNRFTVRARATGGTTSDLDLGQLRVLDVPSDLAPAARCVEGHYEAQAPRAPVVDVGVVMDVTVAPAAGEALYTPEDPPLGR